MLKSTESDLDTHHSYDSHLPSIPIPQQADGTAIEYQFYQNLLLMMNRGTIPPHVVTKIVADLVIRQAQNYEASPTRELARLVRLGVRTISHLRGKTWHAHGSEKEQKKERRLAEAGHIAIESLARKGTHCIGELFLKFGFFDEAYHLLKQGRLPLADSISNDRLQPLVSLALTEHDEETLLSLAEHGVCLQEIPADFKRHLAQRAVESLMDRALHRLVLDGCPLHDADGQSPLFLTAVSYNCLNGVAAMITRHVNVHTKDSKGNTPLHRAFFLGSLDMVRLLSKHIDPQSTNAEGHTPLLALFYAQDHNSDLLQLSEERVAAFLQTLLERPSEAFQGVFFGSRSLIEHLVRLGRKNLFPPPGDLVELAFLLNDTAFSTSLLTEVSKEDFQKTCQFLLTRYPQESVLRFSLSHWQLDERHFSIGCEHFDTPTRDPETNPPLERLLALFDSLNFTRPDAEHYIDPVEFLKNMQEKEATTDSAQEAQRTLRNDLEAFIQRFRTHEHFYGVPVEGKRGFIEFFDLLTREMKHIIAFLEQKNNPEETQKTIFAFIAATHLCGGRHSEAVLKEYIKVCCGRHVERPEEALFKSLAQFRFDIFESIVSRIPDNDVHDSADARRFLGGRFGVPGYKQAETFDDPYTRINREAKRIEDQYCYAKFIEDEFRKKYNPHTIVRYLIENMEQNEELRDHYWALHKPAAPSWKLELYGPILDALPRIEATQDSEEKEALLMSVMDVHGILKAQGQSNREAVLEDQESDFRANEVFDGGHLRPRAVERTLERLGVCHSLFCEKRTSV